MIYAIVQAVIITLIVGFCAVQMLRRLMPNMSRDVQARVMKMLGRELAPAAAPDSGCGSGCSSCKGCSVSFDTKKN